MSLLEENINILKSSKGVIPFDAIEYLMNHKDSDRITDEIITNVKKASNEDFKLVNDKSKFDCTPLWFLLVSEKHINIKLVEFLSWLCGNKKLQWDLLNEQINYLVSKSCFLLKTNASEIYFKQIYSCVKSNSSNSYLFLSESFYFLIKPLHLKYLDEILTISDCIWHTAFVHFSGDTGFQELIPKLNNIKDNAIENLDYDLENAAEEAIENLHEVDRTTILENAYFKTRYNWKEFYSHIGSRLDELISTDDYFESINEHLTNEKQTKLRKIGRNDLCPCGSGIKYKKCCLSKLN